MSHILSVSGASKSYGAVVALRSADLTVERGEVHAICGDNGAGKSTLIKLISGVETPSGGVITVDGAEVSFASPHDALEAGIATIHQDLGIAPRMAIYQNVFMGSELEKRVFGIKVLDRKTMMMQAREHLGQLNSTLTNMNVPVENLSGGQRQAVAITRALRWKAKIIIMDEPTAALGVRETTMVLDLIRRLKERGTTIILISHNMNDVVAVADSVTILSSGKTTDALSTRGLTAAALTDRILS
ncbi:ATP-binding cassette domain-containing protein [Mesorhizobium sp.]|uniref:ATP-binding cassette domain-containing protein n=1 Tax=Mesorhizobium sp. TaxID=1871066 RepID=UPI000FE9795F|nr:ATP-binding cassette domain-containing protein [Mesorhizobium sp.]RWI72202.1 MAG: sugar ABC transporter ATP-binding protein [Mesorhizobium sp.]